MALVTAGYWHTTFWTKSFWPENYWTEYGPCPNAPNFRTVEIEVENRIVEIAAETRTIEIED